MCMKPSLWITQTPECRPEVGGGFEADLVTYTVTKLVDNIIMCVQHLYSVYDRGTITLHTVRSMLMEGLAIELLINRHIKFGQQRCT